MVAMLLRKRLVAGPAVQRKSETEMDLRSRSLVDVIPQI